MRDKLLVSAKQLAQWVEQGEALVFDCRFDLFHPGQGRNSWLAAHIPGAVYAHLDEHLSGRITAQSGRHPLPVTRAFATFLSHSGWTPDKKVIAYDAHGGVFAARLWWLFKYFDLPAAFLLDGGIGAWMKEGFQMQSGAVEPERQPAPKLNPQASQVVTTEEVLTSLDEGGMQLLDARAADRFEGQAEPIDTVAGHIPGALNHPTSLNLVNGTFFRSSAELLAGFRPQIGRGGPTRIVHMCGSGVTACHNQFAMELAGLEGSRLYPGSWSEWIRVASRPIVQGRV